MTKQETFKTCKVIKKCLFAKQYHWSRCCNHQVQPGAQPEGKREQRPFPITRMCTKNFQI